MQELESRSERRFNEKYERFQEKRYDDKKIERVRAGYYILLGISITIQILMLAFVFAGVFQNEKIFLAQATLTPLPLFFYIIVFHDFARIEDYSMEKSIPRGVDRMKARDWQATHFCAFWWGILLFFSCLEVYQIYKVRLQCYKGVKIEWMVGAAIFLLLFSIFMIGVRPKKIYFWDTFGLILGILLMTLIATGGFFYATLGKSSSEKVHVSNHYKTTGKNVCYYADIERDNGESLHLDISPTLYKAIEEEKTIYLYFQEGAFGTVFAHLRYAE